MKIFLFSIVCFFSLLQINAQPAHSFFAIHCDPYEANLYPQLRIMVDSAEAHNVYLTLELSPQWVYSILTNPAKLTEVKDWQERGHEIAAHHHGIYHCAWDSLTNYLPTTTSAIRTDTNWVPVNCDLGVQLSAMAPFWDSLDVIAGDSLLLTWASSDENPAVDMYPYVPFRTSGGRDSAEQAFSDMQIVTHGPDTIGTEIYGPYHTCQIDHYFIDNNIKVGNVIGLYGSSSNTVVGVVTHVNDFNVANPNNPGNFFYQWLSFIEGQGCKTVRQIMRAEGCQLIGIENEHSEKSNLQLFPNPTFANATLSLNWDGLKVITVSTMQGQKIFEKTTSDNSVNIDTKKWAKGIYMISVLTGTYTYSTKLLKQ